MTIKRPDDLKCIRCKAPSSRVKRDTNQRKGSDWYWRYMKCSECGEQFWWGSPLIAGLVDMVMRVTPKLDYENKTINVDEALPIGATEKELASKARDKRIQNAIIVWMNYNRKTIETLTEADRKELVRVIKSIT